MLKKEEAQRWQKKLYVALFMWYACIFSTRFDLTLVVFEIKGAKGSQKQPTPKVITVLCMFTHVLLCYGCPLFCF